MKAKVRTAIGDVELEGTPEELMSVLSGETQKREPPPKRAVTQRRKGARIKNLPMKRIFKMPGCKYIRKRVDEGGKKEAIIDYMVEQVKNYGITWSSSRIRKRIKDTYYNATRGGKTSPVSSSSDSNLQALFGGPVSAYIEERLYLGWSVRDVQKQIAAKIMRHPDYSKLTQAQLMKVAYDMINDVLERRKPKLAEPAPEETDKRQSLGESEDNRGD